MDRETACRIDIMLARAQILLAFLLVITVTGLCVMLILFHGAMSSTATTIVSTIIAQLVAGMILGIQYFLSRPRPHVLNDNSMTQADPNSTPGDSPIPTMPAIPGAGNTLKSETSQ